MKKTVAALLALLTLFSAALADTVALGTTGLGLVLPSSYKADALTDEDIANELVGVYISPDIELDIYQYDAMGLTAAELADSLTGESGVTETGSLTLNGMEVGYALYSQTEAGETWYCASYMLVQDGTAVDLSFWMTDSTLRTEAAETMKSLITSGSLLAGRIGEVAAQEAAESAAAEAATAYVDGPVRLGTSSLYLSLPAGCVAGEVPASYASDGMTAWYYNDTMDVQVYQYATGGYTLQQALEEDAAYYNASESALETLNGMEVGRFVSEETGENGTWTVLTWLIPADDTIVELDFFLDDASEAISVWAVMETLTAE